MRGVEFNSIIDQLTEKFAPFKQLDQEKLPEIADAIRVIEIMKGEVFQLRGEAGGDYLFLLNGHVDLLLPTGAISLLNSESVNHRPFVLPTTDNPFTLIAGADAILCHVNRVMLDQMVSWSEVTNLYADAGNEEVFLRLSKLKNCSVLRSLPLEKAEMAFRRMREIKVKKGDEIVRAGEPGYTFYIIASGRAELWRRNLYDNDLCFVETLSEGSSFGNGALITCQSSDRTVRMVEDGTLLALDKPHFDEIIGKQLIKSVNAGIARSMLESGYRLLDVRYEEEFEECAIPGATLIPLHDLAKRINELERSAKYIVYCHSGNRSAVAVMRLAQHAIEAWSLEGGIRDWPYIVQGATSPVVERRSGVKCRRKASANLEQLTDTVT